MEKDIYTVPKSAGTTVLKTIKLTEPIVKPIIETSDLPSEVEKPASNVITRLFNQLKNITYELFK
ncbi:hypothetical protein [Chryseobacterium sp.]|uniref:hypothetical protein n=1 Tax=Chryseobacterium sp. TaxID=1871047 RepID=UPI0025BAA1B3|nr:hypothetical protein [Chryseobacterium sp.]